MERQSDRNAGKFTKPRSWAAKWCGYGLAAERPAAEPAKGNGRKFSEPRGWSAKWCSGGLGKPRSNG
jgi:hypothetical protein